MMPELKESYLHNHPFKLEKGRIELWKVESVLSEDCDPPIERYSFSCTPVFFDKKENINISRHTKKQCKSK